MPQHPDTDKGQARGNSGVYLQDRYEIQILDSFGLEPKADDCGAIYGKKAPLTNACRKAGEWQSYDVGFKAARFDAAGKKIANARASVWQNGLKIHDDVEIDGPTVRRPARDARARPAAPPGPRQPRRIPERVGRAEMRGMLPVRRRDGTVCLHRETAALRSQLGHRRGRRKPAIFRSRPGGLRSAHRLSTRPHR